MDKPTPANRPVRARKNVTLYSDDNPQTFTIKTKKRQGDEMTATTTATTTASPDTPSPATKRRRGRPPKNKTIMSETVEEEATATTGNSSKHTTATATTVPPSMPTERFTWRRQSSSSTTTTTTQKQQQHPRKKRVAEIVEAKKPAAKATTRAPAASSSAPPISPPRRIVPKGNEDSLTKSAAAVAATTQSTSSVVSSSGTVIPHTAVIQPILPVALPTSSATTTATNINNNTILQKLPSPTIWKRQSWDTRLSNSRDLQQAPPFTCFQRRSDDDNDCNSTITTTRSKDDDFAILGDAVGCVWLIRLSPLLQVVSRLVVTAAAQREIERDLPKHRTVVSFPNAILQVAWHKEMVVVLSNQELQGIHVQDERVVFTINTQSPATSHNSVPELRLKQNQLLWVLGNGPQPILGNDNNNDNEEDEEEDCCTLWTVQTTTGQCRAVKLYADHQSESAASKLWSCWAAIWDESETKDRQAQANDDENSSSKNNCILVVISRVDPPSMLLCRYQLFDNDDQPPLQKESCQLPMTGRGPNKDCGLQIHEQYVFVSGGKGIRVHDRKDLTCLQVYGEGVSLHGKSVMWKSCWWMAAPSFEASSIVAQKKQTWIQHADELIHRYQWEDEQEHRQASERDDRMADYLLVGVPHPYREPRELQSTLTIWKPGQAAPYTTLEAPSGGGLIGVYLSRELNGWRMVCVTAELGHVYEHAPSLTTNFAGAHFPVGYQVVQDNIEYIEDEDELDQVVTWEKETASVAQEEEDVEEVDEDDDVSVDVDIDPKMDPDLAEAMRLSLMELKREKKRQERVQVQTTRPMFDEEGPISVLLPEEKEARYQDELLFPCRPQRSKDADHSDDAIDSVDSSVTPTRDSPLRKISEIEFLTSLPQLRKAREDFKSMLHQHEAVALELRNESLKQEDLITADLSAIPKPKGKRNRATNVETMINASVVPALKHKMALRASNWADGSGSTIKPGISEADVNAGSKQDESEKQGEASLLTVDGTKTMRSPSPSLATKASAEEREIAQELLHLSPSPKSAHLARELSAAQSTSNSSSRDLDDILEPPLIKNMAKDSNDTIVTPSEQSPSRLREHGYDKRADYDPNCPACRGRFVIHKCGKREIPVDYESIERAERERKEQEEKEKQLIKIEKRRAAEARRREARKQKKEEEEELQRRQEKEELDRLNESRFLEAHDREIDESQRADDHGRQLHNTDPNTEHGSSDWRRASLGFALSPLHTHATQAEGHATSDSLPPSAHGGFQAAYSSGSIPSFESIQADAQTEKGDHGFSYDSANQAHATARPSHTTAISNMSPIVAPSPSKYHTLKVNGTELKPSATLAACDALSALARLADEMAAVPTEPTPNEKGTYDAGVSYGRRYTSTDTTSHTELGGQHLAAHQSDWSLQQHESYNSASSVTNGTSSQSHSYKYYESSSVQHESVPGNGDVDHVGTKSNSTSS